MDSFLISNCKNLRLRIFVIGYAKCGESILLLFIDNVNENVLFSVVIDSYKYKKSNLTMRLLRNHKLKESKLNVLCWSHPDMDHSKGIIDIIKQYCDENTVILVPEKLNGFAADCIDYNKGDLEIVKEIFNYNRGKKKTFNTISVTYQGCNMCKEFKVIDEKDSVVIRINALSPISTILNDKIQKDGTNIKKNDLSIVLDVDVNSVYHFLFCSDIENPSIGSIRLESVENPLFIKIPHHTSETSDEMLNAIQKTDIACTTVYAQHSLPNMKLLNRYVDISRQVDCTGTKAPDSTDDYGIIQYEFDLFDKHEIIVSHKGNAYKVTKH